MAVSPLPMLGAQDPFPHPSQAWGADTDAPGLLCVGADLSPQRLLAAYRAGIFPWYSDGQPILWWSTEPRMVLRPDQFHLPTSLGKKLRQVLRQGWRIEIDHATQRVIEACAGSLRPGQAGTWIVTDIQRAYARLAALGHVHSVEVWQGEALIGGLYCVSMGKAVFGESMFFTESDASKVALCALVALCRAHGVEQIDCQQQTEHLARFGAAPISRGSFLKILDGAVAQSSISWRFEPLYWKYIFGPDFTIHP